MKWMRLLVARLGFQKLRRRLLAAMILISLPPLFILGYISFNIAKDTLMQTNAETYESHLETSSGIADMLFRNIITLNRSIVVNNDIREELVSELPNHRLQPGGGEESRWTFNQLQRIINNNFWDTKYVNSICIMNLKYQIACSGRSDDAGVYETADKVKRIQESDWYKGAFESQGSVLFYGYDVLGEKGNSFSTIKLFRDAASPSGEAIGVLIINVSNSIFKDVFNQGGGNNGYMVLDSSSGEARLVASIGPRESLVASGTDLNGAVQIMREQGYLVSQYRNQTTGWTMLHLVRVEELLKQSRKIGKYTTIMAASMGLLAVLLAFFISGSITRPLLLIKRMMLDWTKGVRRFQETFGQDEVGTIGETFKRLASENMELNEKLIHSELKEREAELRALQAQIKPHFLYNTLDSIYWMATLQNNKDIAQMAVSLSESFKLSLNKGKDMISVYKELQHIHHYMTIQNIRYNGRFQYIEEVEDSIMGMEIMKLMLQPLVENAIYHGLEPKVGPGTIRLTGRREDEFLLFTVEDDGVGMEDLSLTEKGYGLRNVRERMTLCYGPSSSFRIFSEPGQGTRIEIRFLPYQNGGDL